jgi:hypothetical protein
VVGVIISVVDAPIEVQLGIDSPVVEGSALDVVIRATAQRELRVTAANAALVAKVAYQYCVSGFSFVRSHRLQTVTSLAMPPWGRLDAADSVCFPISLAVPAGSVGSVEGSLAQVSWRVEVRLAMDSAPDLVVDAPVDVLTRARPAADAARAQPTAVDRRLAVLAVEDLSSRLVVPGVPLSGALAVAAWRPWTTRAAQVSLIRRELIRRGPWLGDPGPRLAMEETEADVLVARQTLAEDLTLHPGRIERLPFTLPVPRTPRVPSTDRDDFTIRWILHARLKRRWRAGPVTELELHGVTAPPGT